MKKCVLILEGKGDVNAAPSLVSKIGAMFGELIYVSDPPIRAGEAPKLRRSGELERYLQLAARREEAHEILLLLDLDDLCAKEMAEEFSARAKFIEERSGKKIHICFVIKEYESWFLDSLHSIRQSLPDHAIAENAEFENGEKIRGAKEALNAVCKGRGYKQIRDQVTFTKKIDICKLYLKNRSFRKFVRAVTGKTYAQLDEFFSDQQQDSLK